MSLIFVLTFRNCNVTHQFQKVRGVLKRKSWYRNGPIEKFIYLRLTRPKQICYFSVRYQSGCWYDLVLSRKSHSCSILSCRKDPPIVTSNSWFLPDFSLGRILNLVQKRTAPKDRPHPLVPKCIISNN